MIKAPVYSGGQVNTQSKVRQATLRDFTGGLNLSALPLQLRSNECPDCMDVDFPTLGGVVRRKAIGNYSPSPGAVGTFDGLWSYERSGGGVLVLYARSASGGTLTNVYESSRPGTLLHSVANCQPRAITVNNTNYVVFGTGNAAARFDGVTFTPLTNGLADDSASLPHGCMPRAKTIAFWQQSVWVGNIVDPSDGQQHPSMVRWSWPNEPEDWPSWAKEEIAEGERSDEIVALVPHGERLLIFKRNSIHAIHGQGPNDFRRVTISDTIGCTSQSAVVRTDTDVYFFDAPRGLYRIGPTGGPVPCFEKIRPIMSEGRVIPTSVSLVTVSWVNDRIWVSVPFLGDLDGSAFNSRTYIYNPVTATWTVHGYGISQAIRVQPIDDIVYWVAFISGTFVYEPLFGDPSPPPVYGQQLGTLEQAGDYDSAGDIRNHMIVGRFQTAWADAGDQMVMKRWRRLGLVLSGTATMQIEPRLDYSDTASGTFSVEPPTFDSSSLWGVGKWGVMLWSSGNNSDQLRFEDGRPPGQGRVLSAVISNTSSGDWAIGAVNLKYVPRKRRD